jgi:hypothetical protein
LHAYEQAVPEQVAVALATPVVHADADPNVPLAWQLSMLLPEQVVWPGAQTPVQAPVTHVWFEHAVAELHAPLAWQVSTPLPEQVVWPGAHTPEQTPLTQVVLVHAAADPQVPSDWQV